MVNLSFILYYNNKNPILYYLIAINPKGNGIHILRLSLIIVSKSLLEIFLFHYYQLKVNHLGPMLCI